MLLCIKVAVGLGSLLSLKEIGAAATDDTYVGKMEIKFLMLLAACLIGVTAQLATNICSQVCRNPRQVLCPGPATAADCKEGQVFKANGSFCGCCNACYTHVGANKSCLAVPSRGIYYQCPDGYICSYREYCEKK